MSDVLYAKLNTHKRITLERKDEEKKNINTKKGK